MRAFVLIIILSSLGFASRAQSFDWMLGEWTGTFSGAAISEVWTKRDESTIEGKGYVVGKDTIIKETLLIQKIGKHWVYIAAINDRAPVLFTMTSESNEKEIIFENKEHDNPQRIIYMKKENGEMHARTEGKMLGKKVKEEFIYKKK